MPDEISLRDLLYNEETRLVFLRNSLAGDRSDNSYYHRVLSRLKEIETELEPEPKYCDDTDLNQWFEEVGKWAADVAGKPRIKSDTIIYRLIRVSVKCLAGQTRISTVFLPDVFGRRPYERLLDQLHSDVKNVTFNLRVVQGRIQKLENSKSTLSRVLFSAGIHSLFSLRKTDLRAEILSLAATCGDIGDAIDKAVWDANYFTLDDEDEKLKELKQRFERYIEKLTGVTNINEDKEKSVRERLIERLSRDSFKVDWSEFQHLSSPNSDLDLLVGCLLEAAKEGDADAQFGYGEFLCDGSLSLESDQHDRSLDTISNWFLAAAKKGHPKAQWKIAVWYAEGIGLPQSQKHAVKWANKAAEQGIFEAMTALSYGYLKITGNLPDHHDVGGYLADYVSIQNWRRRLDEWIEPNYELGIEWLQKLASTRVDKVNALLIWDSQYYLARCYEDGRGTNKRVIDAYKWSLIASRVRKFARDTEIDRLQDNIDTLTQARIGDEMRESMIADNEKWIREHKTLFERSLNRDLESISEVQDKLAVSMTNDQISTATGLAADWWEEHIN